MFLLIFKLPNQDRDHYCGPFPSERRAHQYAQSLPTGQDTSYRIAPMTIPYAILTTIRVPNVDENWRIQ